MTPRSITKVDLPEPLAQIRHHFMAAHIQVDAFLHWLRTIARAQLVDPIRRLATGCPPTDDAASPSRKPTTRRAPGGMRVADRETDHVNAVGFDDNRLVRKLFVVSDQWHDGDAASSHHAILKASWPVRGVFGEETACPNNAFPSTVL